VAKLSSVAFFFCAVAATLHAMASIKDDKPKKRKWAVYSYGLGFIVLNILVFAISFVIVHNTFFPDGHTTRLLRCNDLVAEYGE